MSELGPYFKTLSEAQGLAVAKVEDGWVFLFTRDKLKDLLDTCDNQDQEKVMIFVKSSAGLPKN